MLAVICQFYDDMLACVRLDDREYSDMFSVENGLRQGCVLAPLFFNVYFTAVLRLVEERFPPDAAIVDSMVQLQRKKRRRRASHGRANSTGGLRRRRVVVHAIR